MACGQAIDVPDKILYCTCLLSPFTPEGAPFGDHAARISTPGAAISGYVNTKLLQKQVNHHIYVIYVIAGSKQHYHS